MRRHQTIVALLGLVIASRAAAAVTPRNKPLPEGKVTTIKCRYRGGEPQIQDGFYVEPKTGIYHYRVYVPVGYRKHPERQYPCLFIMSPKGNATMTSVSIAARMKQAQWIVVMLIEARNGPWAPIFGNFLAAHDDAVKRLRIHDRLKYATGFSGGARACSAFSHLRPGFAGVILQAGAAARLQPGKLLPDVPFYVLMGDKDRNLIELAHVKAMPHRSSFQCHVFPGGHQPAPTVAMNRAFDWFEEQLLTSGNDVKVPISMLVNIFDRRYRRLEKMKSTLKKYDTLSFLQRLGEKDKLAEATGVRERVKEIGDRLAKMEASRDVQKELAARAAAGKLDEIERDALDRIRLTGLSKSDLTASLRSLEKAADQIAKKHAGTEYAKKAPQKALAASKQIKSFHAIWNLAARVDEATAFLNWGVFHLRRGEYDASIAKGLEAIRLECLPRKDLGKVYFNIGAVYHRRRKEGEEQCRQAIKYLTRASELDPEDASILAHMADAHLCLKEYDQGIRVATIALKRDPSCHTAYQVRARAHLYKKDYDKAIADANRALALSTTNKHAQTSLNLRMLIYQEMSEYGKVLVDLQRMVRMTPENPYAVNSLAWFLVSCEDAQYRDPARGLKLALQLPKLMETVMPVGLDTLAAAYAANGNFAKAVKYEQKAIDASVEDAQRKNFEECLKGYRQGKTYAQQQLEKKKRDEAQEAQE